MIRRLLNWLRRRTGGETAGPERGAKASDEATSERGFTPSRLDVSVLEAHGMGTAAAERELESIEETAETLESRRPDGHEHGHE